MTTGPTQSGVPIVGAVLAGGLGRRMGTGNKAFADLCGRSLIRHVLDRLAPQVEGVVISAGTASGPLARLGWPVCPAAAEPAGIGGPLAGIVSALAFAVEARGPAVRLLTTPADTPLLPVDLGARLGAALDGTGGALVAFAASGGRDHPLSALWSPAVTGALTDLLAPGRARVASMRQVVERLGGVRVIYAAEPVDPFLNVNTPEDIVAARHALTVQRQA